MEIEVIHNIDDNRFEVNLNGEQAVLIYLISNSLMVFLHTEVPVKYEGKGIAGKMARAALEYARQKKYKVRSYCSYITVYLERHQEYQDLLG
jgi:predicted GNAT family acetyltransferase